MRGYKNANVPLRQRKLLDRIVKSYRSILKNNLVGIYLHGSLAMGCFNPKASDIDFLVVVKRKLSISQKKVLLISSLKLSRYAPAKGLEMSVVLLKEIKHFKYPTPFELHYSNEFNDQIRNNTVDYTKQYKDEDLAAHFVSVRVRGIKLYGQPIKKVFFSVPHRYYLKSLLTDNKWAQERMRRSSKKGLRAYEVGYYILNSSRMIAYFTDKLVLSKAEGVEYGLEHFPLKYGPLLKKALRLYRHKQGARGKKIDWNQKLLRSFSSYVGTRVKAAPTPSHSG